ncbi:uncharacterized protein N7479_009158 [Penicillium vulpinum]|uniref:Altered inheritance of mitochondria protein 21 n=1 Tax=Penicillium vulpinum TaxID=29845 RepID=A0A1V6RWW1_9EURO|nr:uncharacterized protein N7479_009158 [Penicillium vulpinum]KAJ5950745.1 hypothetical protein N7479_009158 [Penicillium vulpinum]OQE05893.1 hypothetical protein PENVUL_c021G04413 [Penicillium vulpinum]
MSTQTAPVIPPRPARSPRPTSSLEMPKIPPRPGNRRNDRSVSPMRDSYAPSPFNEWTGPNMSRTVSNDLPPRPPSVTIPSLGEEGIEYADLDPGNMSDGRHQTPAETRNVSSDLKIHAPRPSLPTSSAEAKVQTVTRTDSRQAAAAGLGRGVSPAREEQERSSRSLNSRTSGSRAESSTASNERRHSALLGEEQGFRVPMYPNAGDVQAPSPSPYLEQGLQRSSRNHNRTRSARDSSLPPGSYGLHGHGIQHPDKFEKAWYEKHPDEFVKEEGQYGPGVGTPRPDWAMSSDDLNKIVRSSAHTSSGIGTSPTVVGTPEEEVGYIASDEYIHLIASPPPDARIESQPAVESPLRQMSFPSEATQTKPTANLRHRRSSSHSQREGGVIHVDDPMHPLHHPDGFAPTPATEENESTYENAVEDDEPILAADEVRPESAYLHPAVSPTFDRRASFEDEGRSRTPSVTHSRSNSRSASAQGQFPALTRYDSREDAHTPLEDVEEYEPLFPEEDAKKESAADRFKKRPDTLKHRFPSQDIWEDTPNSLQLQATVTTPDLPKRDSSEIFETPEQEVSRKMQNTKLDSHQVASHILEGESVREKAPVRPDTFKQRFPSRDIWEDAPDSHQLVTTVEPAKEELKSPEVPSRPGIPPRPQRHAQSTSPSEKRQPPSIPDRPKPQVPTRPAKPSSQTPASTAEAPRSAPAVKAKPAIPVRPGGSKIAAMKAGFLTDLNSRLQLGPQQPKPQQKEPEPPAEKQPLSDARKGRARGPARRKPAEKTTSRLPTIPEIKITESLNIWQVGEDGNLVVGTSDNEEKPPVAPVAVEEPSVPAEPEQSMAPPIAKNTAGESVDPTPGLPVAEDVTSTKTTTADVQPVQTPAEISEPAETSPVATESADKHEEKDDVIVTKPSEPVSEPVSEPAPVTAAMAESVSAPAKLEDALEDLAASAADVKRKSDGNIQPEQ